MVDKGEMNLYELCFGDNNGPVHGSEPFKYPLLCPCATKEGIITCALCSIGCICCAAGYNDAMIEGDCMSQSVANFTMMMCLPCLWPCFRAVKRRQHRKGWDVKNDCMWIKIPNCLQMPCDMGLHCCCPCCALAQESNEIALRK